VKFDPSDINNLNTIINPSLTGSVDVPSSYMMNPNSNTINKNYSI